MKKFTKAWDDLNKCPVDIRNISKERKGQSCNCSCLECNAALIACQGDKNAWHFRHFNNSNCTGGPMTALHLMAQDILSKSHRIKTKDGTVNYFDPQIEYRIQGSSYSFDVAGKKKNDKLFLL